MIDLRGNFGGDFHAAVDSAMLFVPEGEILTSLRMKNGAKQYSSTLVGARPQRRVILWQDEATASAAELFVAALTENGRATTIGRKTFGKGTRQDVIELADGAALILTTAYLRTPKGTEFNGVGLLPNEDLGPDASTAAYLAGTARSSRSTRISSAKLRADSRFGNRLAETSQRSAGPRPHRGWTYGSRERCPREPADRELLGSGAMGSVYFAENTNLPDIHYALKVINPDKTNDEDFRQRFHIEAKNQCALDHPNIVQVLDFFKEGEQYCLLLSYVEGKSLESVIKEKGRLPEKQALAILSGVLQGLDCAHRHGIIHRDVKPSNVMIDRDERARLTDFGIAIRMGDARSRKPEAQPAHLFT